MSSATEFHSPHLISTFFFTTITTTATTIVIIIIIIVVVFIVVVLATTQETPSPAEEDHLRVGSLRCGQHPEWLWKNAL